MKKVQLRQWCLEAAAELLISGKKPAPAAPPTAQEVIKCAKEFEAYLTGKEPPTK